MHSIHRRGEDQWLENTISKEDLDIADVSNEICYICKRPGKLLLCDGPCKRAFHFRCLMLRQSDVGEGAWYCDDCLSHRPLSKSIYDKPKEDDISLLRGDSLDIYNFLYNSVHTLLDNPKNSAQSFYPGVQLLLVISEISHSAMYPLCSSVFHLLHFCIDRLSTQLDKPIVLNNINDFQNCLDLLQLVEIMEKAGLQSSFKTQFFTILPRFGTFQKILLQLLSKSSSSIEASALIRILLLSCYLLHRLGFDSPIPIEAILDLSLLFVKKEIVNLNSISTDEVVNLLRFLQTFFFCLSRNGELLLNCELFPYIIDFLKHPKTRQVVEEGDAKIISWFNVIVRYLSYNRPEEDTFSFIHQQRILDALQMCQGNAIPIGCNCVRALFPRDWTIGFGPYPTSAFTIINKHNDYRNITPTSIKMFPLSILNNLTGLYLNNDQIRSGTIINGNAFATQQRFKAIQDHVKGKCNLAFTSIIEDRNVIGTINKDEVFTERKEHKQQKVTYDETPAEIKLEEEKQKIHRKAMKRAIKLTYIHGIESEFYNALLKDDNAMISYYKAFTKDDLFSNIQIDGIEVNSYILLISVLECGGIKEVTDAMWETIAYSLGFKSCNKEMIHILKMNYESEFHSFEKWLFRALVPVAGKKAMTEKIENELWEEKKSA